jgi:intracellular sulfur oxidation DsrE/DsrF family protein
MTTARRIELISALVAGLLMLFLSAPAATAQDSSRTAAQRKQPVATTATRKPAPVKTAVKNVAPAAVETKRPHRLAVQVNVNEPAAMNLALNNAVNVAQYYKEHDETVEIEIVAYGPGLHMLRDDTSPVKERIRSLSESTPNISFKACGNTQQNMQKVEAKDIPLVSQAKVVKSGVVRLMELQEQGWSYIRP